MDRRCAMGEKAVSREFKLEAVRLIKQRGAVRRIVSATDCACTELRACTSVAIARLIAVDVVFKPLVGKSVRIRICMEREQYIFLGIILGFCLFLGLMEWAYYQYPPHHR
jgi:hypothetical protein